MGWMKREREDWMESKGERKEYLLIASSLPIRLQRPDPVPGSSQELHPVFHMGVGPKHLDNVVMLSQPVISRWMD